MSESNDGEARMNQLLRSVIWRRRKAYLTEAVHRGIITEEQAEALHLLHMHERRTARRRDAVG